MIKTFEQFVSAKYGKPVNEGFQSSKLREIIKQHGLPKNDRDKKMLYDLQDDEIIDVVNNRDEYFEKYDNVRKPYKDEDTFIIELEDGSCIVISNLGILKDFMFNSKGEMEHEIKKRHKERHKGNLGKNGGDDIHRKHMDNVNKLEQKRLAHKLQQYVPEIVEFVNSKFEEIDTDPSENYDDNYGYISDLDINLGGVDYIMDISYGIERSGAKKCGAYYYDVTFYLSDFEIVNEDGVSILNDDLGITPKTYKDLFKEYTIEDVEGEIYDYYEYYGVSRKDFY